MAVPVLEYKVLVLYTPDSVHTTGVDRRESERLDAVQGTGIWYPKYGYRHEPVGTRTTALDHRLERTGTEYEYRVPSTE